MDPIEQTARSPMTPRELTVMVSLYAEAWPEVRSERDAYALAAGLRPYTWSEARGALAELVGLHASHPTVLDVITRCSAVRRRGPIRGPLGSVPSRAQVIDLVQLAREALGRSYARAS